MTTQDPIWEDVKDIAAEISGTINAKFNLADDIVIATEMVGDL